MGDNGRSINMALGKQLLKNMNFWLRRKKKSRRKA